MPQKKSKSIFARFPVLSSLLVVCILLFLFFFFGIFRNYSVEGQELYGVMAIFSAIGAGFVALLIRVKSKAKVQSRKAKPKTKEIWDITVDGRRPQPPRMTYSILGALVFIFLLEVAFFFVWFQGEFSSLVMKVLITLGASSGNLVLEKGEWYRLFTAVLLHGGFRHILFNAMGLLIAGMILEHLAGPYWLGAAFALCGLGGTLMSMVMNPPETFTVGASGAIMGLMGASYVISFRLKESKDRKRLQSYLFQVLLINILPFLWHRSGRGVDYSGHLGGALAGIVLGGFLFVIWDRTAPSARWNVLGKMLAYGGLGVYLIAIGFLIANYS